MEAPEITRFLTWPAVDGRVVASTQNQAISALLFLYREVLELAVPWLDGVVRARRPARLSVVLTRKEVRVVLQRTRRPAAVKADLARHLQLVPEQHRRGVERGFGWVDLPGALARNTRM